MISQAECTWRSVKQVGVIALSKCNAVTKIKNKNSHRMVIKIDTVNNAAIMLKYVFQINEKENIVRTINFKVLHHWILARYILQPTNELKWQLHITKKKSNMIYIWVKIITAKIQ